MNSVEWRSLVGESLKIFLVATKCHPNLLFNLCLKDNHLLRIVRMHTSKFCHHNHEMAFEFKFDISRQKRCLTSGSNDDPMHCDVIDMSWARKLMNQNQNEWNNAHKEGEAHFWKHPTNQTSDCLMQAGPCDDRSETDRINRPSTSHLHPIRYNSSYTNMSQADLEELELVRKYYEKKNREIMKSLGLI